jgi:hypothetical protein
MTLPGQTKTPEPLPADAFARELVLIADQIERTAAGARRRSLYGLNEALMAAADSAKSWAGSIEAENRGDFR